MRSDVFEKSTKFMHTDDVFAWSLYGVFPGLLGQFTLVTYPRRTGGKCLTSSLGPRDAKGIGLGTKGPTYDSLRCIYFLARIFSPAGYFFLKSPIPPPPPPSKSNGCAWANNVALPSSDWSWRVRIYIHQSKPLPRSGYRHVVSRGFLPLFLRLQVISGGEEWWLRETSSVFSA